MFRARLRGIVGPSWLSARSPSGSACSPIGRRAPGRRRPGGRRRRVPSRASDDPPQTKDGPAARDHRPGRRPVARTRRPSGSWASWPSTRRPASGGRSTRGCLGPGPVSPDGRYLVYSSIGTESRPGRGRHLGLRHDGPGASPADLRTQGGTLLDRTTAGRSSSACGPIRARTFETWRVNADGTGRTRLPIPEGDLVLDASRDGTWLATRTMGGDPSTTAGSPWSTPTAPGPAT